MFRFALATVAMAAVAAPASAAVIMTYEAPGVTNTTQAGTFAVQTFDSLPQGVTPTASGSFSSIAFSQTISGVSFGYNGVSVQQTDQFGGAGGTNYGALYNGPYGGTNNNGAGYTLNVNRTVGSDPINYFGLYISASDDSNSFTFYKNNIALGVFTLANLRAQIGVADQGAFFANFNFTSGQTYDKVVFSQPVGCCGFESDNHTVGTFVTAPPPGTGIPLPGGVPEAATWVMMIAGFGVIGYGLRRRKGRTIVSFA